MTIDDSKLGTRDKRGNWRPNETHGSAPLFHWPFNPIKVFKWLFGIPGYILPWNFFYGGLAVILWLYFTPSIETMKSFHYEWVGYLLIRNLILVIITAGGLHFFLWVKRTQGYAFKYTSKWMDKNNPNFYFKDQTLDNMFWTLCSGVPIWTAAESFSLWAFSNGYFLSLSWNTHPIYLGLIFLIIPLFRELHFYLTHRLLHWPPLYNFSHYIHHKNINPGPWSGISMHWLEHILYFSGTLIHFIIPAHPVHAVFQLMHAAVGPAFHGHIGFEKIQIGNIGLRTHTHPHYLHHKYFECNYADGSVPLDKFFGTFHDGSEEDQKKMIERYNKRMKKMRSV